MFFRHRFRERLHHLCSIPQYPFLAIYSPLLDSEVITCSSVLPSIAVSTRRICLRQRYRIKCGFIPCRSCSQASIQLHHSPSDDSVSCFLDGERHKTRLLEPSFFEGEVHHPSALQNRRRGRPCEVSCAKLCHARALASDRCVV